MLPAKQKDKTRRLMVPCSGELLSTQYPPPNKAIGAGKGGLRVSCGQEERAKSTSGKEADCWSFH